MAVRLLFGVDQVGSVTGENDLDRDEEIDAAGGVDVHPVVLAVDAQRGLVDENGRHGEQALDGGAVSFGEGIVQLHDIGEWRRLGERS